MSIPQNAKVVLILAHNDYQDIEYGETRKVLEEAGVKIAIASSELGTAIGKFGDKVKVDMLVKDINVSDFDAVIFIGGPGAVEYIDNLNAHKVIQETINQNKVLGAICIAPVVLAKAGVLKNKKATVWNGDGEQSKILEENGAAFIDENVVVDEKIITANGPDAAIEFGNKLSRILNES